MACAAGLRQNVLLIGEQVAHDDDDEDGTIHLFFDPGLCQDNPGLLLPEEEEPGGERDHQQQLLLIDDATNIPEEY